MTGYNKKKKILIVNHFPVYPARSGGAIRISSLCENMRRDFDVQIVTISNPFQKIDADLQHKFNVLNIRSYSLLPGFICSKILNLPVGDIILTYFSQFSLRLNKVLDEKIRDSDIVMLEHPYLFSVVYSKIRNNILIYDAHNVEYTLKSTIVDNNSRIFNFFMGRLKKIEQWACNKSQIILATSEHDKYEIVTYFSINPKKIIVVPNGTDTKNILPSSPEHKSSAKKTLNCKRKYSVLFFGSGHLPNKEAAQYIVNHLAPSLPDFDFLIAGNVSKNKKRTSSNVTVFGEVTDEMKELILSASDIALNPVISGSGTNLKILEYLSAGIPVISTSIGARGLAIEFDKDIIVVTREKFKEKIIELSQNGALYKNIQHNGRSAVVEKYDWEKIADVLIQKLSEIEKTPGIINFQ